MNLKRNIFTALIAGLLIVQASVAGTQPIEKSKARRGSWSALSRNGGGAETLSVPDGFGDNGDLPGDTIEPQEAQPQAKIVGTWLIRVPDAPDAPGFSALQTFHEGGTFTETSDLLGQLVEGPAHGAWTGKKNDFRLTFQLFAFDEDGLPTVRIRVRCTVHLVNDNQLTATATVDIIEPDGNIIPAVATSPFTGTRVQVLPQ